MDSDAVTANDWKYDHHKEILVSGLNWLDQLMYQSKVIRFISLLSCYSLILKKKIIYINDEKKFDTSKPYSSYLWRTIIFYMTVFEFLSKSVDDDDDAAPSKSFKYLFQFINNLEKSRDSPSVATRIWFPYDISIAYPSTDSNKTFMRSHKKFVDQWQTPMLRMSIILEKLKSCFIFEIFKNFYWKRCRWRWFLFLWTT